MTCPCFLLTVLFPALLAARNATHTLPSQGDKREPQPLLSYKAKKADLVRDYCSKLQRDSHTGGTCTRHWLCSF